MDAAARRRLRAGTVLNGLFDIVDEQFWKELRNTAPTMSMARETAHRETVDTYDVVELHLEIPGSIRHAS